MKKMFAKLGMPSLLSVALLLGGLLFGANSAQAQTTLIGTQNSGPIKTTGTWKSSDAAKISLTDEIATLNQTLNVGTGNPNAVKMKLTIYSGILVDLEGGVAVPDAALANYNKYKPGFHSSADAVPSMPTNDWQNIYVDMLSVLQL